MSERAKQVIDFKVSKGITVAQSNEHQRRWTEKGWESAQKTGNYDRTREHLNFEIVKGKIQPVDKSKSIPERMAENLRERGIKDPNEGLDEPKYRTIVNFIFGGSRERMHEIAFGDKKVNLERGADNSDVELKPEMKEWAMDIYKHACELWGEENIIGFYVHNDETNPHIHCTLLPIDKDNKFAFKKLFAGKDKYEFKQRTAALHDSFAKVNEKWGLYRGDSVELTGAKHRTTEEYRRELNNQCVVLEDEIERRQALLQELYADIRLAERRVKGLSTMVEKLTISKSDLESKIDTLQQELKSGQGDSENLKKQIEELNQELSSVQGKLDDKQAKLDDADRILEELNDTMEDAKQRTAELHHESDKAANELEQQVRMRLASAALNDIIGDFRMRLPSLDQDSVEMFDTSMIMDLADKGEHIITCAMFLFAGYVKEATAISQSSGGGGSCSKDWGRKPDEDERAWALRCMRQACRMMRPSGNKKVRR